MSLRASTHLAKKLKAVQSLLAQSPSTPPLSLLLSMDTVADAMSSLATAFPPPTFTHAFAIKCNPSAAFLSAYLARGDQFSLEAASEGEVEAALRALVPDVGVLPSGASSLADDAAMARLLADPAGLATLTAQGRRLVFDAPLKRRRELRRVIAVGGSVNIDNWQELAVLSSVMDELPAAREGLTHVHGVRINPQVGAGSMAGYSTGTATAKFGVGVADPGALDALVAAYDAHPWLRSIMCHVGSQGVPIDLAVAGIRKTVDTALTINERLGRRAVRSVDIGGGLPVNFASDEVTPTFAQYADALRSSVPELFDGTTFDTVTTEFGRAVVAKAGFFLSRIEYTKETGGRPILIQNVGADIAIRTVYLPKQWPLRVTLVREDGSEAYGGDGVSGVAQGTEVATDVAGPCCIQADIIAHERPLPPASPGDWVLVHDVGGYYHASHSRFNLRQMPDVWAFSEREGEGVRLAQISKGETIEDTLAVFAAVPGQDVVSLMST
jgi:diaminopimelate decarboxylase